MKIILGSRGSDLALTQTRMMMARVCEAHPNVETELRVIKTTGDNKPDAPLAEIGGLGAFTREIEVALLNGEIDVAVHSLKDLPTKQPDGLAVAAVVERARPSDALVSPHASTVAELAHGARVGTSSLRRKAQLLSMRPDLHIHELRGNVPTRMRRAAPGDLDAVILASAGLIRLGLFEKDDVNEIPLSQLLPAPGQGALALEVREDADEVAALLAAVHDDAVAAAVQCERAVLQAFGGGCRAPLGAYARTTDGRVYLQAFAAAMETNTAARYSCEAALCDAVALGEDCGRRLRDMVRASQSCVSVGRPPLQHKRVVVTRAHHQSQSFAQSLASSGASVFCLPCIEVTPLQQVALPDKHTAVDWLVLTSVNAVHAFEQVLRQRGDCLSAFNCAHIAAIGASTAAAVHAHGRSVDVLPEQHVSDALAEALLQAEPQPEDKHVLIPQSCQARTVIAAALAARGMRVSAVTVYETTTRAITESERDALRAFAPECIVFFSPSAVRAYIASGVHAALMQDNRRVLYASIGPVTTAALREEQCEPIVEAAQQNESALKDAIIAYYEE